MIYPDWLFNQQRICVLPAIDGNMMYIISFDNFKQPGGVKDDFLIPYSGMMVAFKFISWA